METKKSNVKLTIFGLALGLLLAALDQTIVSTAMPTIVGQLGGLDKFVWVFSAYLIANVVSMPVFGKLSDMYGRKRFFLLGLGVFMIGSALCGTSNSMLELIIYRVLQGIGGGALMPVTFTIVYDLFPPEKRGKMQGLFGAVFGISSVLGPLAGAYFTDFVNWQWIFYINLPLGVVSFALILLFYHPVLPTNPNQKIDWAGTVTFASSILCLMFALELGGKEFAWDSLQSLALLGGFVVLMALFIWIETKAVSPIVPLQLFRGRLFTSSMGMSLLFGGLMMSAASYIPLFIQGVYQGSATNAGQVLTPMMLGVVASSMFGGRFIGKTSYRKIMLVSTGCLLIATGLLANLSFFAPEWVVMLYGIVGVQAPVVTPQWIVVVEMVLMGLGIGVSFPVTSLSSLHDTPPQYRGIVTSLVSFSRSIGSALGVTVLSMIQTNALNERLASLVTGSDGIQPSIDARALLSKQFQASIPTHVFEQMVIGLSESISVVFVCTFIMALGVLVCVLLMGSAKLVVGTPKGVGTGAATNKTQ